MPESLLGGQGGPRLGDSAPLRTFWLAAGAPAASNLMTGREGSAAGAGEIPGASQLHADSTLGVGRGECGRRQRGARDAYRQECAGGAAARGRAVAGLLFASPAAGAAGSLGTVLQLRAAPTP